MAFRSKPALPLISCVTSSSYLNSPRLDRPHLQNKDNEMVIVIEGNKAGKEFNTVTVNSD